MIYLIGYMGSGKSTVASLLSKKLNYEYIEMDQEIERKEGMEIPQIFKNYGEDYFRNAETDLLKSIRGKVIVSTGGGVILSKENRDWLIDQTVIFLDASFDTIDERLKEDTTRPLWSGQKEENKQRYQDRLPLYQSAATHTIKVDKKEPEEIAEEILSCLNI
ncbi:shikimate kinase [Halobacillus sp. Marseille-Q1614]|uniref:shikimate kinase n=1 Tax=Halobacillus sp. Marseille-Q1614 TaxID=2709134 RepID=UPI00156F47AB|nr:shikimate kinase [Halobacillus sp. Marseille-Q1614]